MHSKITEPIAARSGRPLLLNAFSIAKLNFISIKASANLQTTNNFWQRYPSHFNIGRLHELIVDPAWNKSNKSFVNESGSNKNFQLVDDSKSVLNSEGARAVSITSYSVSEGAQRHSSGNAIETSSVNIGKSVSHQIDEKNEFRLNYVGNNYFQQPNLAFVSKPSQLIVTFILIPRSEG